MIDVLIIGGGVAGAATALMLRQHQPDLTVMIIERSAYQQVRIGETLPPQTGALFRQLNVWDAFLAQGYLPSYGTSAVWGSTEAYDNDFLFTPHGHGWHLDRRAFDCWMASEAVQQGVALQTETRFIAAKQTPLGWQITIEQATEQQQMSCRFVVDATGRLALFARQQAVEKMVLDQLVGVCWFLQGIAADVAPGTLIEALPFGWLYSAQLPSQQLIVALMSDADLVRQQQLDTVAVLADAPHTWQRMGQTTANIHAHFIMAAHTQWLTQAYGDNWLAVGDAACTFDPLSSQGIFKALQSGILAAYAISDCLNGDEKALAKYDGIQRQIFEHYYTLRSEFYGRERRWPEAPFWQRRHGLSTNSSASTKVLDNN